MKDISFDKLIATLIDHPLSESTWKKLIKDFDLPIQYVSNTNMVYTIEHSVRYGLDPNIGTVLPYLNKLSQMSVFEQQVFMGLVGDILNQTIKDIKDLPAYNMFNTIGLQYDFPLVDMQIPTGDIYARNNIGEMFISVDIRCAAFNALSYWDRAVGDQYGRFFGSDIDSYRKLMEIEVEGYIIRADSEKAHMMEDEDIRNLLVDYLNDSKQLRQVLFGNLNPKRIQHIEKYMVQQMVKNTHLRTGKIPVRLNNDEAIYEYNDDLMRFLLECTGSELGTKIWKVESFDLSAYTINQIVGQYTYKGNPIYVKQAPSGVTYKCLPTQFTLAFEAYKKGFIAWDDFLGQSQVVNGYLMWMTNEGVKWEVEQIYKS